MKIDLNRAIRGMNGTMDNWVYKRFEGRTIVSQKPEFRGPPSLGQIRHREAFARAAEYAKAVFADPARKAAYADAARAAGRTTVFALAMGDYLKPPAVRELDLGGYFGRSGDTVRILASDDFEVTTVKVTIRRASGATLEQGLAVRTGPVWIYRVLAAAPAGEAITIEAEAADRAGNERTLSEPWQAA